MKRTISRNYLRKYLVSGVFELGGKKKITQPLYQKLSEDMAEAVGFEPTDPAKGLPDFESGPL